MKQYFDRESCTYTYLLWNSQQEAILIDPVLTCLERDLLELQELGLSLKYIIETHIHADHVTSASELLQRFNCEVLLSSKSGVISGARLLEDQEKIDMGDFSLRVLHTPGHTNGCISLYHENLGHVYSGDTLLIGKCGRTDFQEGSSQELFHSVREKLFTLPDETLVFPGHDYTGRLSSTIAREKKTNKRLNLSIESSDFEVIMNNLNLSSPKKIEESVSRNLKLGQK